VERGEEKAMPASMASDPGVYGNRHRVKDGTAGTLTIKGKSCLTLGSRSTRAKPQTIKKEIINIKLVVPSSMI